MSAQRSIANRAALGRAGGGWWWGCSAGECSGMWRRAGWYLHHAYLCALRLHCLLGVVQWSSFNRHRVPWSVRSQQADRHLSLSCASWIESKPSRPLYLILSNAGLSPKLYTHLPPTLRVLQVPPSIPVACRDFRQSLQYQHVLSVGTASCHTCNTAVTYATFVLSPQRPLEVQACSGSYRIQPRNR